MTNNLNSFSTNEKNYESESRLSSIAIDVESQENIQDKNINNNLSTPLRGILKKSSDYSEEIRLYNIKVIKIFNLIALFIVSIPIIFCDIYYGYSNSNCINKNPNYINVSLKLYLLLSGFINILLLILSSLIIIFIDIIIQDHYSKEIICAIKTIGKYMLGMFNILWNIIGSVIFWGYYYEQDNCNAEISTYLFISLLIKLLASSIYLYHKL